MAKYYHIQLNEIEKGHYACHALEISYQHYKYIRKNFGHFFFDSGEIKRIVLANCEITHGQALALASAHAKGKFKLEDTGDWD